MVRPVFDRTAAAPSVSGLALPAVMVPAGLRSNTGLSTVSLVTVVSGRISGSWSIPSNGWISCLRRPSAVAAWAFMWLRWATSSCSSREIFHSLTISSVCSPMVRPVDGSAIAGARGLKCHGRSLASSLSLALNDLAFAASTKMRVALSLKRRAGCDIDSAPPAMPTSARPATMES